MSQTVLRIHLFWCGCGSWIRTGKKMDQDPGHVWFTESFKQKIIFKFFVFFSHIFIPNLDEPFRNGEIFVISLFFKSADFGFRSKKVFFCSFWLIFYPLDLDPWIRTFLRIRIQEAKILRIQRIRILLTGLK